MPSNCPALQICPGLTVVTLLAASAVASLPLPDESVTSLAVPFHANPCDIQLPTARLLRYHRVDIGPTAEIIFVEVQGGGVGSRVVFDDVTVLKANPLMVSPPDVDIRMLPLASTWTPSISSSPAEHVFIRQSTSRGIGSGCIQHMSRLRTTSHPGFRRPLSI